MAEQAEDRKEFSEEEKEEYGRKVRTRFKKMEGKLQDAMGLADRERKAREDLEARLEAAEARIQESAGAAEQSGFRELEQQSDKIEADLKAALDGGDIDSVPKLQRELADARANILMNKRMKEFQQKPPEKPVKKEVSDEPPAEAEPSRALRSWSRKNKWIYDQENRADTLMAQAVEVKLKEEGFDPEDDEFFDELDNRLKDLIPHRYREKPAGALPPDTGDGRGERVTDELSKEDKASMSHYNLDPSNPEHKKAWVNIKAGKINW